MKIRWTWRKTHVWTGIGLSLWLLLIGATGVLLTFRASLKTPEPSVPEALWGEPPVPPMELVAEAERLSGAKATELYFSTFQGEAVCVVVDDERASEYYFSPGGTLLAVWHGADKGLTQWAYDLHTGVILGRGGELLSGLAGVGILCLAISGVVIWPWRLRRAKMKKRAAAGIFPPVAPGAP